MLPNELNSKTPTDIKIREDFDFSQPFKVNFSVSRVWIQKGACRYVQRFVD